MASHEPVVLEWLDKAPPFHPCGVTWGVPWPQGEVQKTATFALTDSHGTPVPVQTWPLAFWPDGSLKWTGHAANADPEGADALHLSPGPPALPAHPVRVQETDEGYVIDTGALQCHIPREGESFVTSLSVAGRIVAQEGRLVCLREDRSRVASERITQEEEFTSRLDGVTLEQSGPVRAVVKIEGRHRSLSSERAWLPFVIRLYFHAGLGTVRLMHTFVFDGDQDQDFIRGLGVRFAVPLREELHNRHVRLTGEETGLFAEPVRVIAGRRNPSPDLYAQQIAGKPLPALADLPLPENVAMMAAWDGWKLVQASADSFSIQKRTGAHSAWIPAASGTRSPGLAFVGDTTGGLALGMTNFRQLAPTALEITGATTDAAELTLWLWYSFLRTGRADVFRMAEAMTRHTQEVDVYHAGPFQGLATRHNVRHWGCGAKEARIGQAGLKRFLHYLTADERMGDLMDEVTDTDVHTVGIDPLRKIEPSNQHPTHTRVGPDWFAFCSNWLAAWERTGDTRYRDKIIVGMKCLAAMPHKLFSGFCYGYDPERGTLTPMHDTVEVPHLAALMGGPELMMELTPLIGLPEWDETWLHYCRYLQASVSEQISVLGTAVNNGRGPHYARMTAYAAHRAQDPALAVRAWRQFLGTHRRPQFSSQRIVGPDVPLPIDENSNVSTTSTAQWCLNAIELLALVGEFLPESFV